MVAVDYHQGRGEEGNPRSSPEPAADRLDTLLELYDLLRPPAWQADAACREHPEVDWFAVAPPGPVESPEVRRAKDVCAACLVRVECLAFAYSDPAARKHGVWGGVSASDRRIRRAAAG